MDIKKYGGILPFLFATTVYAGTFFSVCTPENGKSIGDIAVEDWKGFTHQYIQMNAILLRLDILSIVGFPCNQFGHQEPADNRTELENGLRYVRPGSGYVPSFDMMKKIDVNGKKEAPLYTFLKESCQSPSKASFNKFEVFSDPIKPHDITWNFEKFLIDESGRPVFRFLPQVEPNDLVDLIREMSSGSATTAQLKQQLLKIDKTNKERDAKVKNEKEEEQKENNA